MNTKSEFLDEKIINSALDSYKVPSVRSKEDAWSLLVDKMEQREPARNKIQRFNWIIGAVAAVVVFGLIMYVGMFNTGKYSPDIFTGVNQTDTLILPDNSRIILNSNSKVKYSYNKFTRDRDVYLNGEAFFEVQKGKRFNLEFNGGKISVLGTSFDVIAYHDNFIQVDCVTGRVEVEINDQKLLLTKGYGLKYFNGNLDGPYEIDQDNVVQRVAGLYYWKKVSVEELLHVISQRFNYTLEYTEGLEGRNFSGKIDLNNLKDCLNIVSYAMELRYTIDEKTQTIKINAK